MSDNRTLLPRRQVIHIPLSKDPDHFAILDYPIESMTEKDIRTIAKALAFIAFSVDENLDIVVTQKFKRPTLEEIEAEHQRLKEVNKDRAAVLGLQTTSTDRIPTK